MNVTVCVSLWQRQAAEMWLVVPVRKDLKAVQKYQESIVCFVYLDSISFDCAYFWIG